MLLCLLPGVAWAHAVPTAYLPAHAAALLESPGVTSITFSEPVDPATATLTLYRATGTPMKLVSASPFDARVISAALPELSGGVTVVWGVTSLLDGHYTHGAFYFSVKENRGETTSGFWKRIGEETHLALIVIIAALLFVCLHLFSLTSSSWLPRSALYARAYVLLEILVGCTVAATLGCMFIIPVPFWQKETTEEGIVIRLFGAFEGGEMFLAVASDEELPIPLFEVGNRAAGVDPMPVALDIVFRTPRQVLYRFPQSVFVPHGDWHVSATFVRGNRYDAHGAMSFNYPADINVRWRDAHHPPIIWGALLCALFASLLLFLRAIRMTRR
jgi:methionine-rich copper-binding protein CopC